MVSQDCVTSIHSPTQLAAASQALRYFMVSQDGLTSIPSPTQLGAPSQALREWQKCRLLALRLSAVRRGALGRTPDSWSFRGLRCARQKRQLPEVTGGQHQRSNLIEAPGDRR